MELEFSEQEQVVGNDVRKAGQGPPVSLCRETGKTPYLTQNAVKGHCVLQCREQVEGGLREIREIRRDCSVQARDNNCMC